MTVVAVFENVEPLPPRQGQVWNGTDLVEETIIDSGRRFVGYSPRTCGEHRTVGEHRAWCFDCREWCYSRTPDMACEGCLEEEAR